eukprot:6275501-Amphidinium_carterae.1
MEEVLYRRSKIEMEHADAEAAMITASEEIQEAEHALMHRRHQHRVLEDEVATQLQGESEVACILAEEARQCQRVAARHDVLHAEMKAGMEARDELKGGSLKAFPMQQAIVNLRQARWLQRAEEQSRRTAT